MFNQQKNFLTDFLQQTKDISGFVKYLMFKKINGVLTIIRLRYSKACIPREKITVRERIINNYKMLVLANEYIGRIIYFCGFYEKAETEFISDIIKKDDVCVDIGANFGYYTLLMASKAIEGKVYSFEPVPLYFHLLSCNAIINNFNNVILNKWAVSNINGEAEFFIPSDGAYASLKDTKRKPQLKKIKVPLVTLDKYIEDNHVNRVDFIKIDVEGAEKLVLEGASKLLGDNKKRPRLMMIELSACNLKAFDTNIRDILVYMKEKFGYESFILYKKKIIPFEEKHYDKVENVFFSPDINLLNK